VATEHNHPPSPICPKNCPNYKGIDTNKSYLIHRLNKPDEPTPQGDWNVKVNRAFGEGGGGLGLSDEARKLFRAVCNFDYMGAAEFEFGAVPNVLREIADKRERLVSFSFVLEVKDITPGYWRERQARELRQKELEAAKKAGKKPARAKKVVVTKEVEPKTFYCICAKGLEEYTKTLILNISARTQNLKENCRFSDVLDPEPTKEPKPWHDKLQGWLVYNPGIFFFVDKTMHDRMANIFQVEVPSG
jgi:hypothetical protein